LEEKVNLRIPGPTPCPPEILEAASKPMINHRGPEFKQLLYSVTERLKQVFETSGDVFILSTSGTGGLEAAIVNTLSPGDKVLSVSIGYFGNRFRDIAQAYGAQVVPLDYDWGSVADPDQVRQALMDDPEIKAVMITHNETSTGVTNDLETIAGIVKGEFDRLLLVDAVSSLASIPLPVHEWRCDVVAMGLWALKREAKSSRARNCATVNLLVSLITSSRVNLPNHSVCQTASVLSLSTILKNCSM